MTIRPLEFNAMLQNTAEATRTTANEGEKGALQQQNITMEVRQQEEQAANSVRQKDDVEAEQFNYNDKEGDAPAYQGREREKGKKQKKKQNQYGHVVKKGEHVPFDMKI